MQHDTDLEYERYKDWDFSNAKKAQNPVILELQARKKALDGLPATFFDQDVQEMLFKHNNAHDRARANTVLRALFAQPA